MVKKKTNKIPKIKGRSKSTKVIIKKGDETKTIKFKKFEQMEKDGWELVEA